MEPAPKETPAGQTASVQGKNTSESAHGASRLTDADNAAVEFLAIERATEKRFATLQARCALAGGYVLRRLADGNFFVSGPGGVTRDFDSLDRIENWLAFVEGRPK